MNFQTSLCSFPHGTFVVLPFFMVSVASVMSFRALTSCNLVKTEWSIDCSSSIASNCVYIATMEMGLLVKETFVAGNLDENGSPEMLKMCQWYTDQERQWLLDKTWDASLVIHGCATLFGLICMVLLLLSSTYRLKVDAFRTISLGFGLSAILNMSPLLIIWKSEVCTGEGICDDSLTNCVSSCQMGTGSWQLLATSVMWISAMISSWVISPARPTTKDVTTNDIKDEESQKTASRSSSFDSDGSKDSDKGLS